MNCRHMFNRLRFGAALASGIFSLSVALAPPARAATDSFTVKIAEKQQALSDPTDESLQHFLMWDMSADRVIARNMPYLELSNDADSTSPITAFHLTIGDTRFHFDCAALGSCAMLGKTTPDVSLSSAVSAITGDSASTSGDQLNLTIGNGGLQPGQVVRFKIVACRRPRPEHLRPSRLSHDPVRHERPQCLRRQLDQRRFGRQRDRQRRIHFVERHNAARRTDAVRRPDSHWRRIAILQQHLSPLRRYGARRHVPCSRQRRGRPRTKQSWRSRRSGCCSERSLCRAAASVSRPKPANSSKVTDDGRCPLYRGTLAAKPLPQAACASVLPRTPSPMPPPATLSFSASSPQCKAAPRFAPLHLSPAVILAAAQREHHRASSRSLRRVVNLADCVKFAAFSQHAGYSDRTLYIEKEQSTDSSGTDLWE